MPPLNSSQILALLLDIEGTTTPIDFVFKSLFPYAAANVEQFLGQNHSDAEIKNLIAELRSTWSAAASSGAPVWIESSPEEKLASAASYVRWLIDRDSKITPVKTLQGKIWEQGFRSGALKGEVYPDVAPAFARWRRQGRRIAIFSSGSVLAQKLLFSHSTAGDLSSFIEAFFDTTTGPKREPASYKEIAAALSFPPDQILFVSDIPAELDAARAAHLHTAHSLRPGIPAEPTSAHPSLASFDQLFP
ncbi:MAG TPA: acireductone synthase [Candidatus Acidoferrum sp.]|nr:acireductone synthase [Candidatus Acidoferrum sp.]